MRSRFLFCDDSINLGQYETRDAKTGQSEENYSYSQQLTLQMRRTGNKWPSLLITIVPLTLMRSNFGTPLFAGNKYGWWLCTCLNERRHLPFGSRLRNLPRDNRRTRLPPALFLTYPFAPLSHFIFPLQCQYTSTPNSRPVPSQPRADNPTLT